MHPRRASAFTLIELLTVMGIIAILLVLVAPAVVTVLRGNHLTQSGEMVGDQIVLARQSALTGNRPVQVRFYQLPVSGAGNALNFAAIQTFQLQENGQTRALTKLEALQTGVVFAADNQYSTLLSSTNSTILTVSGTDKLAAYNNQDCKYVGFQFLPNGSTDLDPTATAASGGWFVTLIDANRPIPPSGLPVNYYTLHLEPLDGRIQTFRP